jgi:flavin-dependent dehydrogenase
MAGRIVGADGRSSLVRRWLGLDGDRTVVSSTAGLRLDDAELPFEGFGHLVLRGPGPAFIYRIGPRHIRACLDVPACHGTRDDPTRYLWQEYGPALPEALRPAFRRALETRPIAWAANQFRPRSFYGRDGLALVGDAVGSFHPLTAVGLTLGFLDGECLARSRTVETYRQERSARSHVPELMATVLYEALAVPDRGARALRRALYVMLRADSRERSRTMRLLAAEDTGLGSFSRPFLKVVARAAERVVKDMASVRQWPNAAHVLLFLHRRLAWLATNAVINVLRPSGWPGTAGFATRLAAVTRFAAPVQRPGAAEAPPLSMDALSRHSSTSAVPAVVLDPRS